MHYTEKCACLGQTQKQDSVDSQGILVSETKPTHALLYEQMQTFFEYLLFSRHLDKFFILLHITLTKILWVEHNDRLQFIVERTEIYGA